jgi:hypothetical protein
MMREAASRAKTGEHVAPAGSIAVAHRRPRQTRALRKLTWVELKLVLREPLTLVSCWRSPSSCCS